MSNSNFDFGPLRDSGIQRVLLGDENNVRASIQNLGSGGDLIRLLDSLFPVLTHSVDKLGDRMVFPYFLYLAYNQFINSILAHLRLHFADAQALTRNALEATVYAHKIDKDPEKLTRIWADRDNERKSFNKGFRPLFSPKERLDDCDLRIEPLRMRYEVMCNIGSHVNLGTFLDRFRHIPEGEKFKYTWDFFDTEGVPDRFRRDIMFLLGTYSIILDVFKSLLKSFICRDGERIEKLFAEKKKAYERVYREWTT